MAVTYLNNQQALSVARNSINSEDDAEAVSLMDEMTYRRLAIEPEQSAFAAMCDHWDNLYYPQMFTKGGASHWADDKSATEEGRSHVSVNSYPVYVDVPAALTSYTPIENMVPIGNTEDDRAIASAIERVFYAWKDKVGYDLLAHKACTVKCLYGRTAVKVFWDAELNYPCVELIDQPRNLYLGWRSSQYTKLDWAIYAYAISAQTALEDYGLVVEQRLDSEGKPFPAIISPTVFAPIPISQYQHQSQANPLTMDLKVEVNDYWYRRPRESARIEAGKPVKFETCNAVFVGNVMVRSKVHPEYRGQLPYIPLFNSYIPGMPTGRSNLHDIEQMQREVDERMSENAQMIHRAISGQYWQLTGPESPPTVPAGLKPVANQVIAPGPGNRIEALQPWMPEFQMDQYLARAEAYLEDISGMNPLMRGKAPQQVMSSSKAVSALVANYETRISMPRQMFYDWRLSTWELAATVWAEKVPEMKGIIDEKTKLLIQSPSLTPRDDAESAQIASNLKEMKLWSSVRAMDRVGVDDPETEQDMIRAEQTDATLNPAAVQVMVSLMLMLQQLQQQMPQQLQQQGQEAAMSTEQAMAGMRGQAPQTAAGPGAQGPGEQPVTPAEEMPGNTAEGVAVGAGQPAPGEEPIPSQALNQFQIAEGEVKNRLIGQQQLQEEEGG